MPDYSYKAVNTDGGIIEDVIDAPSVALVADKLDKLGFTPINIKEHKSKDIQLFSKKEKVSHDEIVIFTKQLFTLMKAGVPFLTSLEALAEQASSEKMRGVIKDLYVSVESGKSFSEALTKHNSIFNKLYISTVRAGEISGQMEEVLQRMVKVMEYDKETKDKIRSAMRYPIIVVCALVLAFVTLILLVVPKFATMFEKMGAELPLPTKILIGINDVFQGYGIFIFGFLAAAVLGFMKWKSTEKGRQTWDTWIIKIPVFGDLVLKNSMSRFARMFETLNRSGLPILQTLEIVSETVGNVFVGGQVLTISKGVERGEGIARPLRRSGLFPPMVVRMVAIGEQSGSLDEMLANISSHYDVEVDYSIKKMSSMIEPLLTLTIGIFIMFLALSIFLPMWNMMSLIN
jgi:MSHA biogenesis protein MshG